MRSLRVPLLLFVVPAMLVALASASPDRLVLERDALAAGEAWRLWTGHWVHFSVSHLLWNLIVLVVAGTWLERVRPGGLWRHALIATPFISLAILAAEPGLQSYGGLSALATGVVVLLALQQGLSARTGRWLWAGVLTLVALKSVGDLLHLGPAFARYDEATVRTSTTAHAAGVIVAALQFAAGRWREWRQGALVGSPLAGARRRRAQAR